MASARAPLPAISWATLANSLPSRATSMTEAPASARARAAPSPRPRLAPVTSATFPCNSLDTRPPRLDQPQGIASKVPHCARDDKVGYYPCIAPTALRRRRRLSASRTRVPVDQPTGEIAAMLTDRYDQTI